MNVPLLPSNASLSAVAVAIDQPGVFFATCARLIGPEVKLTIEQTLPGNLSMEDWQVMREIVAKPVPVQR